MKLKQFTKVVAVSSFGSAFCLFASCNDADKATADSADKPAKEQPAAPAASEQVPVYIVTVSGKG